MYFYWNVTIWVDDLILSDNMGMKGCVWHFTKWQIHPFISKGTVTIYLNACLNTYFLPLNTSTPPVDMCINTNPSSDQGIYKCIAPTWQSIPGISDIKVKRQ